MKFLPSLLLVIPLLTACSRDEMKGIMKVTFVVETTELPAQTVVFVTGDRPELGNWDPYETPLNRQPDGTWSATVAFPYGARMEYKFTLGSWDREAVDAQGAPLPNFTLAATRNHTVRHRIEHWKTAGAPPAPADSRVTGDVRYHRALGGEAIAPRTVAVWLPPGYDDQPDTRYPVLYLHDGQNVFDPATSYTGVDWGVDETATRLIAEGTLPPFIAVAIENSPARTDEYGTGETGAAYRRYVIDVVKPLIDRTYRTRPAPADTATMGSSMGGLVSFLLAWHHPETFGHAACLSPAFFPEATDPVRAATALPGPIRIYMDNGTIGLEARLQPGCDTMRELLLARGLVEGDTFQWLLDDGAEHNEAAWAARVDVPLRFLFAPRP